MSIAEELQAFLDSSGYTYDRQMEQPGLTLAIVTNINDPDKLNRVKCLPVLSQEEEETDWCLVMAPLGGNGCGMFLFPNVNDLVILGYLGGSLHRPVVLGACWNSKVLSPYTIQDGKVYDFTIKTPGGTELHFYDEPSKQKVTLTMPSGTVMTFDDEAQAVSVKDSGGENALLMDLKGGNLELKAKTKLTLSAGSDASIVLESSGNVTEKAKTLSMDATTVEAKASNTVALQGSEAKLTGDRTVTIKGGKVGIN